MEIIIVIIAFVVGNLLATLFLMSEFRWIVGDYFHGIYKRVSDLKSKCVKKFSPRKN